MKCKHCNVEMVPGQALKNVATGSPDFVGGEAVTMSFGKVAELVDCLKCPECGYSVTSTPSEKAGEEL